MHPANAKLLEYTGRLFFVLDPVEDCTNVDPASLGFQVSADEKVVQKVTMRPYDLLIKIIPFHTSSVTKTYRRCAGRMAVLTWQNEQFHHDDLNCGDPYIVAASVPHAMLFECGPAEFFVSFSSESPPAPVWLEGTEKLLRNRF